MVHSRDPRRQPPRLIDLVQLKVYDGVREDERLGNFVKENDFPKKAARNGRLVDFITPLGRWSGPKVFLGLHINSPRTRPLARRETPR